MKTVAKIENTNVPAAVTPSDMLQMAVEQGADLDKLEKLMELQERWEAGQAKKSFVAAMNRFMDDCPQIEKTRKGHNSKYAGLAESIEQIKPALSAHGLSYGWKTNQTESLITVTCTVTHIDGHSESTSLSSPPENSGSKNSIQAIGSAVSYLQRYTLYAILGLASGDQDTDGNPAPVFITQEQAANIDTLIDEVGADKAKLLKYYKAASVDKIQSANYNNVIAALEAKRAK